MKCGRAQAWTGYDNSRDAIAQLRRVLAEREARSWPAIAPRATP